VNEITINEKFEPLFNLPKGVRYFILTGGRRSGKSFAANAAIAYLTRQEYRKVLFTRVVMATAHDSIIPEFTSKLTALNIENEFETLKTNVLNKFTKSEIKFRGIKTSSGDQTAKLKSLQDISVWVIDEAEELTSERTFEDIDYSLSVKGVQNIVIIIMNPTTKEHIFYKKFFEARGVPDGHTGIVGDTCYIHSTYLDNLENLPKEYITRFNEMKKTNTEKYNHIVMGGWLDKAEGVIFENWSYGDFVDTGYTYYGMDFGYSIDPDALVKVSIDNKQKKLYLKLLIYNTGNSTQELARKILQHKIKGTIIADSAEPRLISDLRAAGVDIQPVRKFDGSIRAGIKTMKEYMLIVDHRSPEIAKELNNYSWSDRKAEVPVDDYNHAIDAIRYVLLSALSYTPLEVY
jgi:phage terminase large subunit